MESTVAQRLPANAHEAFTCYTQMLASKDAHFEYLETLHEKYKSGGNRTLVEISHLEGLLSEHNQRVGDFTKATKSLAVEDPAAHQVFIGLLSEINVDMGRSGQSH